MSACTEGRAGRCPDVADSAGHDFVAPSLEWTGTSDKRSYYRLFFGYVIALFATGVATVALALLAFDLAGDDSGAVLGTALSIKMFAYVIAAPIAAALTGRMPRKRLLIVLDLIRAVSLFALPFVASVWQVYGLVFVFALASATFTLVYLTVVPYLLGSFEDYSLSLARSRIATELDGAASPLLAAGLLVVMGAAGIFVLSTVAFLISAALVRSAQLPQHKAEHPQGVWAHVLRGPKLFLAMPQFRGVIALDVAVALGTAFVMVNTVVLVQGMWDMERDASAIAFFAFGLGSILGAVAMPRILFRVQDRTVMLAGSTLLTAGLLAGALMQSFAGLIGLWLLIGLGAALALTPTSYLIRRLAPPQDLQTLFAAQLSIANASLLVAYSAAGWIGAVYGIDAAFILLGLGAALATLAAARLWPRTVAQPDV